MKLSIVVPVFNEEGNLHSLHERLSKVAAACADDYEIILVDDGSRDQSLAIMQQLSEKDGHVKFVSFSRNFGHELASTAGLDASSGDVAVLIDADLQDPPEVIPEMIAKWRQGAHVVYARRAKREGETIFKRLTSYLFYRLINKLSDVPIPLDTGDFRLMDAQVITALRHCRENPRFVRGLVSWVGFKQDHILYNRAERQAGETKYNVVKLIRLTWEAICTFSLVPLHLVIWIGLCTTLLSLTLAGWVAVQKLFTGLPIQGYALIACGIFFLGGVQLMLLGVLARYIGYIFRATQHRPLYIIQRTGGFPNNALMTPITESVPNPRTS